MEPAELLTKRRIEKLASQYEGLMSSEKYALKEEQDYDVCHQNQKMQ